MRNIRRNLCVLVPVAALGLAGCITSPEEQAALREAEYQEALRMQALVEAGECRERRMTGQRTHVVYECGEENQEMVDTAQESVRRLQTRGSMCAGGDACNGN